MCLSCSLVAQAYKQLYPDDYGNGPTMQQKAVNTKSTKHVHSHSWYALFHTEGTAPPLELVRLRRYVPGSRRPTDTYNGHEKQTLHDLGFQNAAAVCLEARASADEVRWGV